MYVVYAITEDTMAVIGFVNSVEEAEEAGAYARSIYGNDITVNVELTF